MVKGAPLSVFGDVSGPCRELARRDQVLGAALAAITTPLIRKRKGGFPGLFRIIVEQQVSVPSAQAIWARCRAGVTPFGAKQVLILGEEALRTMGLTRQKAHYIYLLAQAVRARQFSFQAIPDLNDQDAAQMLQTLKGIGPWSAGIYLLFCEGRIDVWPPGDVALAHSYGVAAGLPASPTAGVLTEIAQNWQPWRGLGAHILWTHYAHMRGRTPI